ncbi:MAG: hypothetical protein UIM53_03015 [Acutalibacteraceae bacterium]|nr:hypothetical protein [Acutalibacteraceae bacterium]
MRYFIDMDGTLAVYPSVTERWWEVPNIFRYLAPQKKVIDAVKQLIKAGCEVYILSAYNAQYPESKACKDYWVDTYLPEIDSAHRIYSIVGTDKFSYVPGGIKPDDVLLDDYNGNLTKWKSAGGIGVKLLNGINNRKSWDGVSVRGYRTTKEIYEALVGLDKEIIFG